MDKYDLRKAYKDAYSAPAGRFIVLDIPKLRYLMVDGQGDPNTGPAYREALEALYAAAYTLKFAAKDELGRDYVVPPLEGLWWSADLSDFIERRKDRWSWTMMLAIPDFVPPSRVTTAIESARSKKKLPGLSRLRVDLLDESRAAQTLHVGSYDDEGPILAKLHGEFLPANALVPTGHHHEIYLTDPRRTATDRLRTVLRQPVAPPT